MGNAREFASGALGFFRSPNCQIPGRTTEVLLTPPWGVETHGEAVGFKKALKNRKVFLFETSNNPEGTET